MVADQGDWGTGFSRVDMRYQAAAEDHRQKPQIVPLARENMF